MTVDVERAVMYAPRAWLVYTRQEYKTYPACLSENLRALSHNTNLLPLMAIATHPTTPRVIGPHASLACTDLQ